MLVPPDTTNEAVEVSLVSVVSVMCIFISLVILFVVSSATNLSSFNCKITPVLLIAILPFSVVILLFESIFKTGLLELS